MRSSPAEIIDLNLGVLPPQNHNRNQMDDTNVGIELVQSDDTTTTGIDKKKNVEDFENPADDEIKISKTGLLYDLEDIPPWYLTTLLGFQHYITMVGGSLAVPFLLLPRMCIGTDAIGLQISTNIISTILFCSGIITLGQTTLGTRLPIIQGGSFSFLIPSFAILGSWPLAPGEKDCNEIENQNVTGNWEPRMRAIQGAIISASFFQIFIGATGLIGILLRYITPLTIAPAICMMGLSLFGFASGEGEKNWLITLSTIGLIILFSMYLPKIKIPLPYFEISSRRVKFTRYPVFQVFPVLLSISLMWIICLILTAGGAFGEKSRARTDFRNDVLNQARPYRFPYPFQWGLPSFTVGHIAGMFAGALAGIIESIGDYYACSRIVGLKRPPKHAVNRGILIEGLGCLFTGIMGTGDGTTSYSENIGALTVTKVGSRLVIQMAAILMILFSFFPKFSALIVAIPDPIVAGVFYALFSIVIAVGLSNLRHVDMTTSRNIFILGFSLLFSLSFSQWMRKKGNKDQLQTGNVQFDILIEIILTTDMFLAGIIGFILDNTIPGTKKERGLITFDENEQVEQVEEDQISSYDLPFARNFFKSFKPFSYIPFMPNFDEKRPEIFYQRIKLVLNRRRAKKADLPQND